MNYYREINKDLIQFDFIYFVETSNNYVEEIKQLGGNVYLIPRPSINLKFKNVLNGFFKKTKVFIGLFISTMFI